MRGAAAARAEPLTRFTEEEPDWHRNDQSWKEGTTVRENLGGGCMCEPPETTGY
jgi:hypothetical protein